MDSIMAMASRYVITSPTRAIYIQSACHQNTHNGHTHLEAYGPLVLVPHMHNQWPVAYFPPSYYQPTTQAQNVDGMEHSTGHSGHQFLTTAGLIQPVEHGYAQNGAVAGPRRYFNALPS